MNGQYVERATLENWHDREIELRDKNKRLAAERDALQEKLDEALSWADDLSQVLMAVNAQYGGRNAARLLKDFRDARHKLDKP